MNRWFRWYEGTTEDGKFRVVARLSRVTVRDVIALWAFMLEDAAHLDHRGVCNRNEDFMASILDFEDGVVERVLAAMKEVGLISTEEGGISICNFGKRQFESDGSAERVRRHRDKRAAAGLTRQWQAPKELRRSVYQRDGFKCVYCGSAETLSLDHRTPEIRGGGHNIENLATCCLSCNGAKRDLTEEEFRIRNGHGTGCNAGETLQQRPQSTETEDKWAEQEPSLSSQPRESLPSSQTSEEKKSMNGSEGGEALKCAKPPRHGAISRDKKFVYFRKGTAEFEAYAEDYRQAHDTEPIANEHGGRWFSKLGEGNWLRKAN
jgi:hypothetical protein